MKSLDIRRKFQQYFTSQGHHWVPSSPLVPKGDPTLLFVNAGMNQFKDYFLGTKKPPHARLCSIQKCLRAGGKHNDLEQVGPSPYHHTFFEMLGFFSFGSYFKKQAIDYSFAFLTKELGLPKERLWVSVFKEDETALQMWQKHHHIPREKIFLLNEATNFWRMGASGPCGPCSEIYFHPDPDNKHPSVENLIEIWNLVFMSFLESESGQKTPLPLPCIDTGMGLERITQVLQEKPSNYETDLFSGILKSIQSQAGRGAVDESPVNPSEETQAFRVLADHARAIAFLLADAMLPSNEGRGYVLRRLIRRASYYEQKLHTGDKVLSTGIQAVISQMKSVYPELEENQKKIQTIVQKEQESFFNSLKTGQKILNREIQTLHKQKNKTLGAQLAFTLYDTHGFPFDLTKSIVEKQGLLVDEKGFYQCMEQSRQLNRERSFSAKKQGVSLSDSQKTFLKKQAPNFFNGYDKLSVDKSSLRDALVLSSPESGDSSPPGEFENSGDMSAGSTAWFVFEASPFYPEGGGQVGDQGVVQGPCGRAQVQDCYHRQDIIVHEVKILEGTFHLGDMCSLKVDSFRRQQIARHHTATHLLHSALRQVLGTQVQQAGSLVNDQKLRFDFTFSRPLTESEIAQVEGLVNQWISTASPVTPKNVTKEEALSQGALAFFEEKYQDKVQVLKIGSYSLELCGGTHVSRTDQLLFFVITEQTGIGAGVRRVSALAGVPAQQKISAMVQKHRRIHQVLNLGSAFSASESSPVLQKIQSLQKEVKGLKKQAPSSINDIHAKTDRVSFSIDNKSYLGVLGHIQVVPDQLGGVAEKLKNQLKDEGLVILSGLPKEGKTPLVVLCTKGIIKKCSAHQVMQKLCADLGGKGGGRPHFARGVMASSAAELKNWFRQWSTQNK